MVFHGLREIVLKKRRGGEKRERGGGEGGGERERDGRREGKEKEGKTQLKAVFKLRLRPLSSFCPL